MSNKKDKLPVNNSQFLIYQTENGETKINVCFQNETVWLTQKSMAKLFQTTKQNISLHLSNIFKEGELEENLVVKEFLTTASDGKKYKIAAEIINDRADSTKSNMGLTNWRCDKIRKSNVTIAKNYLNKEGLKTLNNLVEQYLIFAKGQAMRRIPIYMKDWIEKLGAFLSLNDWKILQNEGSISHKLA